MKKLISVLSLAMVLGLVGCSKPAGSSETPASSQKPTSSVASSAQQTTSEAMSEDSTQSPTPVHTHTWQEDGATTNSDGKTIKNYKCLDCTAERAAIAAEDASSGTGSGKLAHGGTIVWKIVAPKAGNVVLTFDIQMGTAGQGSTIWGMGNNSNPTQYYYGVKVGETDAQVLVNEVSYADSGVIDDGEFHAVEFAKFAVTEGENVITLTVAEQQFYRNVFGGEVSIVYEE